MRQLVKGVSPSQSHILALLKRSQPTPRSFARATPLRPLESRSPINTTTIISHRFQSHATPFTRPSSHRHGKEGRRTVISLIPLFFLGLSSPLLLDSPSSHSTESDPGLASITSSIDHPDSSQFLIAKGTSLEDSPPNLFEKTINFLRDYIWEPLSTTTRFIHLAILFLPVILTSPILLLETFDHKRESLDKRRRRGGRETEKEEGERATTEWWYRLLVGQMERAGPTFIKLAQWAGSRTDLFPASLCILFGKLHSNGKPHSLRYTKKVIERAFGVPFSTIFLEFAEKPMGIGAIAQVYKAVLNPDLLPDEYLGPKHVEDPSPSSIISRHLTPNSNDQKKPAVPSAAVAIKVLHPGVEKMISRDLKIMMFFASFLNSFPGMQWLSFPEEVQVFGEMMMSQVDLRIEANNLKKFEDNFMHRPTVSFPRALKQYTGRQVLVEEYEDAVPLEKFLKNGGGAFDSRIANLGLDAFLNMLLIHNFSHGDLHPGNIMVKFFKPTSKGLLASMWARWRDLPEGDAFDSPTNVNGLEIVHRLRDIPKDDRDSWLSELDRLDQEGYQPEIVFIDAGLVVHLSDKNRHDFLDLFSAVAQFDGYEAGRLMVERCRSPEFVIDEDGFALRMQHLILSVKSQTFSLGKIRIADLLSDVLQNVRRHHVKMEPEFVNTVISILLLEGIGRQLAPDMDLFKSALPILRQLGKQVRASDVMDSGIDAKGIGAMIKIWVWIEARQLASIGLAEVDDLVRYDYLVPSV